MRILSAPLIGLAFMVTPVLGHAHEVKTKPKTDISELKLPTEAEIEDIIDQMPDFNKIMGAMMTIAQDEDIHDSLKDAGEALAKSVEKSGLSDMAANLDDDELPDFNKIMATMMRMTADENVMGEMLDVVTELKEAVEENIDEDMLKPKGD